MIILNGIIILIKNYFNILASIIYIYIIILNIYMYIYIYIYIYNIYSIILYSTYCILLN